MVSVKMKTFLLPEGKNRHDYQLEWLPSFLPEMPCVFILSAIYVVNRLYVAYSLVSERTERHSIFFRTTVMKAVLLIVLCTLARTGSREQNYKDYFKDHEDFVDPLDPFSYDPITKQNKRDFEPDDEKVKLH